MCDALSLGALTTYTCGSGERTAAALRARRPFVRTVPILR